MSAHASVATSTKRCRSWQLQPTGDDAAFLILSPAGVRWLLVLIVGIVDCIWMGLAGFRIGPGFIQYLSGVLFLIVISLFFYYIVYEERLTQFAHSAAQYLSLFVVIMPLGYLTASTNAPLMDRVFDAIDKAIGLDWPAWTRWVMAHPAAHWGLHIAYASLPLQTLFCYWYNAHTRASYRNSEIWWVTFVSALATLMISALLPGISAWVYYHFAGMEDFRHMQHFEAVRAGTLRVISLRDAEGLVQLPSFHTLAAIVLTYNLRHDRWLFLAAFALNAVLILSCPTEGGHYFADIAAGGVVAAVTIWAVHAVQRRFEPPPPRPI